MAVNQSPANGGKDNADDKSTDRKDKVAVHVIEAKPEHEHARNQQSYAKQESRPFSRLAKWWRDPYRQKASWTDKAIVLLTAGIVFLAYMQWKEMDTAGKQTDRIIAADERLATANERFASAMEGSLQQSNKALNATIEESRLDQRAWVVATDMTPANIAANRNPRFVIGVRNTGKTPALRVTRRIAAHIYRKGEPFVPLYHDEPPPAVEPMIMLPPGGQHFELRTGDLPPLTQGTIDALQKGEYVLKVYGWVRYEDVFKRRHLTTFCVALVPVNLTLGESCESYNQAD